MQILRQRREKTINTAPTTLSEIQAASQSTLSMNKYTPLVFSSKQLTIIKPTQTEINRNK